MKRFLSLSLAPLALLAIPQSPALASDANTPVAPQEDGYARLYTVLMSDPGNLGARRTAEILVEIMARQGETIPTIEAEHPGFIQDLEKAMLPLVIRYMRRVRTEYEPMFLSAISQQLDGSEAAEIAAFYESELGQTMLRATRRNMALEATDEELASDEPFTREDAERDMEATTNGALRSIPEDELRAINDYLAARPAVTSNLLRLREPLLQVRVAMDNELMTEAEEEEMDNIYITVLGEYGYELLPE